jgi:4-hydroxybenzoate polyprenyltransferase
VNQGGPTSPPPVVRGWALLRATHLGPSVLVTTFATALAVAGGRGPGALWVMAAVMSGQFSIGWANDYLDRERDRERPAGRLGKPIPAGEVGAGTVRNAALVAVAACVPLSFVSGAGAGLAHLGGVALGWAYDLGLKATPLSVLAYAGAFGLLPVSVALGLPAGGTGPWWVFTGGALLGAGAHFTNALPDLAEDVRAGIRGLPQRLGATASLTAAAVLLGAGILVVCVAPGPPLGPLRTGALLIGLACVATAVLAGLRGRVDLAFPLTLAAAAATIVGFVASGSRLG